MQRTLKYIELRNPALKITTLLHNIEEILEPTTPDEFIQHVLWIHSTLEELQYIAEKYIKDLPTLFPPTLNDHEKLE